MSSGYQQAGGYANSFNNNSFNNIVNFNTEIGDEGRQILQWLSPLEPHQRHQGVRIDRLDSVGNWVLETSEFRKWHDAEDGSVEPVLFCYGNPGVGKTYVSSLVIDSLCDQARGKDVAVVGLYCDFLAQHEQSTANMLGAILKQLANRGGIPEHIKEAFQEAKKEFGGRGLRVPDMVEILKKSTASLPRVFICIDALDECTAKHRRDLLESLREILRMSPNLRIFLTGRSHIDDEIAKSFGKTLRIPLSPAHADIKRYLEMRLGGDTDPYAMGDELRADIMRIIPEKISDIFLLVSLNIDAILGEVTLYQRRKKLNEMTSGEGLGDAYAATLSRMKAQSRSRSKLGMEVLMWVSHAERPLQVDELCHALGAEPGSTDLNIQNIPAIETLLACSLGLVTVEKSSSTVRLVHYTLQEYLAHKPNLFPEPHSMIAEVCLTYLNFQHVMSFSPALDSVPPTAPFIEYASCYWGIHARRGGSESVKVLALKLLDGYDKHISSKILLLRGVNSWDWPFDVGGTPRGFSGLHGAAYFGCVEIIVALLETKKGDVQATDFRGNTAISWAARRGHEGAVYVLLERNDVNPDLAHKWSQAPLSLAIKNGHEGIVRMLLERNDANPDLAHKWSQAPLSLAIKNGHEGIVRMLLERNDVDPNEADKCGETPLLVAAASGHERIVRMLLERNDVNPNKTDMGGRTPLLFATERLHRGVMRMLLRRKDINPSKADKWGRTPLLLAAQREYMGVVSMLLDWNDINPDIPDTEHDRTPPLFATRRRQEGVVRMPERDDVNRNKADKWSQTLLLWVAANGHEGMARMLLERNDVDPNTPDTECGQTPLLAAAANGHEGIVGMLLERNGIDPNKPDTIYGLTPLSRAAERGHEGVVKMLLERNDSDPDTPDTQYDRTPLSWAAQRGRGGVVRMLLERNDVNPDKADKWNQTPLLWAAVNGHEVVVRMLLERNDVDPDTPDTECGQTPLLAAATNGHKGIVRMLLGRNDVSPDIPDTKYGRTPLSSAAEQGHDQVVRMLLGRDGVNPDEVNKWGVTPLLWAAARGHEGIVRMLLERNDVNPNKADESSRTPLSFAAEKGHTGMVRMLLRRNDVNPNAPDTQYGRTPLLWAAKEGHESAISMLLERNDVNPNKADKRSQTPLLWAATNGHERIVRILLERNDVDPDKANTSGITPLSWAADKGHEGIVRMLLEQNHVDPNRADQRGRTPLSFAAEKGHEGVMRMLLERNDVNPNKADMWNQTPFLRTTENRHVEVTENLLERKGTNPNPSIAEYCQTPDLISKHALSLQSTKLSSPEPSDLSKPPSKKPRMF